MVLYTRTMFLKDRKLRPQDKVAFAYFIGQARDHWAGLESRMSQAHAALALHRTGEKDVPRLVTRSLKEHALLRGGQNLPGSDARLEVSLGGETVKPDGVEAGTGFYEKRYAEAAVKPEMGKIGLKNPMSA